MLSKARCLTSPFTNHRYLNTPEKIDRLRSLSQKSRQLQRTVKGLKDKLDRVLDIRGVCIDDDMSTDLKEVMCTSNNDVLSRFPEDSFQYIFWKHQMESLGRSGKNSNGNRWHPLMIRWCLYLRHFSSKSYDAVRESGCIALPSQRTLRDYSNSTKAGAGFSQEVDQQLLEAATLHISPSYHRLTVLLLDEMHVREELVYNKHSGKLVGFVNLGDINNHLSRFEEFLASDENEGLTCTASTQYVPNLANSIMVFMVRGIFTKLSFPFAMFPCLGLVGEQLFTLFWECVFRLERLGFKVHYLDTALLTLMPLYSYTNKCLYRY